MPTSPVLLIGAPALAGPLKAAGVVVLMEGPPDRDFVVVVGRLTSESVPAVKAHIAQGKTVLLLVGPDEDASAPPQNVRVVRLPVLMDELLTAIGADAVGGVVGTAEVGADLSVRPTKARDALGLFHAQANGSGAAAGPSAVTRAGGPSLGQDSAQANSTSDRRGPEPLAADELVARHEPAVAKVPGPWDLRPTAPLQSAQPEARPAVMEVPPPVPPSPLSIYDDLAPAPQARPEAPFRPAEAAMPPAPVGVPHLQPGPSATAYQPAPVPQSAPVDAYRAPAGRRLGALIICFAGKGGVGKCLAVSDTTLTDPVTGVPRRLDEVIADPGAKLVFTLDDGEIKAVPIADKIDSGVQPTFKVTLRSGRHITATANHPLLLADGWRPLGAIEPGETIAIPARMPHPLDPVPLDPAVIDILAVLMAEGGLTQGHAGFTTPDPVVVSIVEQAARTLGFFVASDRELQYRLTCPTKPQTDERGLCQCGCGTPTALATRTSRGARRGEPFRWVRGHEKLSNLTVLLRHHGIAGHTSRTKPMPDAIWRLPGNQLARFLNVFWGCDGYVTKSGIPELALANEPLLRAVQHLLLRFGVQSTIRYKKARCRGKDFDAWSLRVHAGSVASFAEHFPLWGEKGARLLARAGVDHNPNLGGPTVTDETYEEIVSHRRGLGVDDAARLRGWGTKKTSPSMLLLNKPSSSGRRTLSLTGLAAYAKAYGLEAEYGWIYSDDIYWDEVVSVEPAGVQQVWDLSVDNTHCFIANDVVVHNSTLALSLGEQASSLGLRSIVVDANRGQGDLRKYLRVNQAYLPSVVDAATSGDPTRAITTPERLAAARPAGLPVPSFATVLAPTDTQVDPSLVTPEVYREVVGAVRGLADLVIVDTQIVEATDIGGMVDDFMVPELVSGAWGLGISDPSVGADNLLRRIYMLSARGVGPARLMVCLNRVEPSSGLNQEAMARLVEPYATWMGAIGIDPHITTAFESGAIPTSPALEELLGRVLGRVTGIAPVTRAQPVEDKPKKRLFRWKK